MFYEQRFSNHRPSATRSEQPSNGYNKVYEKQGEITYRRIIVSKVLRLTSLGILTDSCNELEFAPNTYRGRPVARHGGWFAAYRTHLLLDLKSKISVVVMANSDSASPVKIAEALLDRVLDEEIGDDHKHDAGREFTQTSAFGTGICPNVVGYFYTRHLPPLDSPFRLILKSQILLT